MRAEALGNPFLPALPLIGGRVLVAALILLLSGCETFRVSWPAPTSGSRPKATLQRMQQTYEDLAAGFFVSIADFETPGQETMFRCVGADGQEGDLPQPTLSITRSRNETGAGGLQAHLGSNANELLLDGKRSTQMALLRDWRPYSLLLMSIYGPPGGVVLEFSVESGQRAPLRWTRTIHVVPGWNLFRLDLATIGDWIDLADVRALGWRAPQLTAPVDLFLDDLILADNTRHLLGESAGPGELYVFTRGRRTYVGARDRFELAFADGQIVDWRSGSDENLVDIDGLGPWPLPLARDWYEGPSTALAYDDPRLFAAWGEAAATLQRVVEMTPFRVVVEGRWRFAPTGAPPTSDPGDVGNACGHTWSYVVYSSGQVLVRVQSNAPESGWRAPRVGYAIGVDGRRGFRRVAPPANAPGAAVQFVLMARRGAQRADLLWTWPPAAGFDRQRELASEDERRQAIVVGDCEAAQTVDTAFMFRFWPADIDAAPEAVSFAGDYRTPATVKLQSGHQATDIAGDFNGDGYNESEGCYELVPDERVLRFDFEPGRQLRFDPVFRVHGTSSRRCWAYARGRLINDVGRDAADNLLFRLGRVTSAPTTVEVHLEAAGGGQ